MFTRQDSGPQQGAAPPRSFHNGTANPETGRSPGRSRGTNEGTLVTDPFETDGLTDLMCFGDRARHCRKTVPACAARTPSQNKNIRPRGAVAFASSRLR